jgi:hypothetical protein
MAFSGHGWRFEEWPEAGKPGWVCQSYLLFANWQSNEEGARQ